ncbi:hypothetical protein FRC17_006063 [Serendipita sp. 399]|nr:hypothetical protein FRC17_006063 [Serendipita sp. 399]
MACICGTAVVGNLADSSNHLSVGTYHFVHENKHLRAMGEDQILQMMAWDPTSDKSFVWIVDGDGKLSPASDQESYAGFSTDKTKVVQSSATQDWTLALTQHAGKATVLISSADSSDQYWQHTGERVTIGTGHTPFTVYRVGNSP